LIRESKILSSVTTKNEKDSLGNEEIKQVVFIDDNGITKMIEVETGISDFENIEILSGLTEKDRVISGPYLAISQKLKDGSIIQVNKINGKGVGESESKSNDSGPSVAIRIGN
jgi:HlyD family secretion protein